VILFLQGKANSLTSLCIQLGAEAYFNPNWINVCKSNAKKYCEVNPKSYLIPFGMKDKDFDKILNEQLIQSIPKEIIPERLWLTVGSGTLLRTLGKIFNKTTFLPVQVGKKVKLKDYDNDLWKRMENLKISKYSFFESVPKHLLPPYSSCPYDAKVWEHVLENGQNGDYVWNVASEEELFFHFLPVLFTATTDKEIESGTVKVAEEMELELQQEYAEEIQVDVEDNLEIFPEPTIFK